MDPNQEIQQCLHDDIVSTGRALITLPPNPQLQFVQLGNSVSYVLLVYRFPSGRKIPKKQGVSLARKIGCDIASYLIYHKIILIYHKIIDNPWICSTDADAQLPDNYFAALPRLPLNEGSCGSLEEKTAPYSALTFEFNHINGEHDIQHATELYQRAFKYYVDGLEFADSAYAYFTIGSILAIDFKHYCLVRGFPKKSAGEDFYLRNKLAKPGPIVSGTEAKITLTSRRSDRVPFGTGSAVSKIIELPAPEHQDMYYAPVIFVELKQLLNAFRVLWEAMQRRDRKINEWLSILPAISLQAIE